MHRSPCSRHRHVELRLVSLTESGHRHADNHLVNRLTLSRVACNGYPLIHVERPLTAHHPTIGESDAVAMNSLYGAQFVISEMVPAGPEVFRDSNGVACRQGDLLARVQ